MRGASRSSACLDLSAAEWSRGGLALACAVAAACAWWLEALTHFLAAITTTMYFGWAGIPGAGLWIGLVALSAFLGPTLQAIAPRRLPARAVLVLQNAAMLALACTRAPGAFTVAASSAALLGSWAVTAMLERARVLGATRLAGSILAGGLLFAGARVLAHGSTLVHAPLAGGVVFAVALVGLGCAWLDGRGDQADLARGPLMPAFAVPLAVCGSLAVAWNLPLWIAAVDARSAAVLLLPLLAGTALGVKLARRWAEQGWVGLAAVAVGLAMVQLAPASMALLVTAHALAAFGTAVVWWRLSVRLVAGPVRLLGLQLGAVAAVLAWAWFLLWGDPLGLWALVLVPATLSRGGAGAAGRVETSPLPWLSAGVLVLAGVALWPQGRPAAAERPPSDRHLTVISSNVRYGWTDDSRFDPSPHAAWLTQAPADIIGLQEINRGFAPGAQADLLELYRLGRPGTWCYVDAHYGFGNALWTGLPLRDLDRHCFAARDMLGRAWLRADLDVAGVAVSVFVTHLSHLPSPNAVRRAQVHELCDRIQQCRGPWILLADLNAQPGDPELVRLLALSHPDFTSRGELLAVPSSPSRIPRTRIDHVLCSAHFDIEHMDVLDTQGSSDHRPVRARLRLR